MMYIVRFIRIDGQPNEEYYYHKHHDAIEHMKLFVKDDSGLYEKIQLIVCEDLEILVVEHKF